MITTTLAGTADKQRHIVVSALQPAAVPIGRYQVKPRAHS
jgi:hypothetical protein